MYALHYFPSYFIATYKQKRIAISNYKFLAVFNIQWQCIRIPLILYLHHLLADVLLAPFFSTIDTGFLPSMKIYNYCHNHTFTTRAKLYHSSLDTCWFSNNSFVIKRKYKILVNMFLLFAFLTSYTLYCYSF